MEGYLVVYDKMVYGEHGPYIVTYPHKDELRLSEIEGSITVDSNGIDKNFLEPGMELLISRPLKKVRGWRAKKVLIPTPAELQEHQANQKTKKEKEK